MKLIKIIKNVWDLAIIKDTIFISNKDYVKTVESDCQVNISKTFNVSILNGYFIEIESGKASIKNEKLELLQIFLSDDINLYNGRDIISKDIFLAYNKGDNYAVSILGKNGLIKREIGFHGKFLNEKFRLNFKIKEFDQFDSFTCSDLLGEKIYWEHHVEEGKKAHHFNVWNDYLIFVEYNPTKADKKYLIVKHLVTGEVYWKEELIIIGYVYDKTNGILVNVVKSDSTPFSYQILDLESRTNEIGPIHSDIVLDKVFDYTGIYYTIYNNKYYFSDSPMAGWGDKKIKPGYIGCFDITSRKLEFLHEVPRKVPYAFTKIIVLDNKLYIMNSDCEVFIFELN